MQMNIDEKWNENHAIYNDIREELTKNNSLHLILTKMLTKFVPEHKHIPKTKNREKKQTIPCWLNHKVFRKIKKKYHAYKRFLVRKKVVVVV